MQTVCPGDGLTQGGAGAGGGSYAPPPPFGAVPLPRLTTCSGCSLAPQSYALGAWMPVDRGAHRGEGMARGLKVASGMTLQCTSPTSGSAATVSAVVSDTSPPGWPLGCVVMPHPMEISVVMV